MNLFFLGVLRPKKIYGTIFTSQIVQREQNTLIKLRTFLVIILFLKNSGSE